MYQEFKNFLKIQNLLLKNSSLVLNETTEIANIITDVLKKHDLQIPEEIPNINKIDIKNDNLLTIYTTDGKKQDIRIGKIIRQLFPNESDSKIENIVDEIRTNLIKKYPEKIDLEKFNFIIDNDVVKWYKYFEERKNLKSCMTKFSIIKKGVLNLYALDDNIKLLIVKHNDNLVARALLWHNTSVGNCIDRIYSSNEYYREVVLLWAKKNRYKYIYQQNNEKITYKISENIMEKIEWLPYMDSFIYIDEEGVLYNYKLNNSVIKLQNSSGTFFDEEIFEWLKYFENEDDVYCWKKYFYYPKIAYEWYKYFNKPEKAYKWFDYFNYSDVAYEWFKYFNDPEVAHEWFRYFKNPELAYKWSEYFDDPEKAYKWFRFFDNSEIAYKWFRYFDDAEEAYEWSEYFDDPQKNYKWFRYFKNPEKAHKWSEYFDDPEKAYKWFKYFDDSEEASKWNEYFSDPEIAIEWKEYFDNLDDVLKLKSKFNDPKEAYDYYIKQTNKNS